jgi:hypothetical protein
MDRRLRDLMRGAGLWLVPAIIWQISGRTGLASACLVWAIVLAACAFVRFENLTKENDDAL